MSAQSNSSFPGLALPQYDHVVISKSLWNYRLQIQYVWLNYCSPQMHHNPTVTLQTGIEEIDPNILNNNEIKHLLYKEIILWAKTHFKAFTQRVGLNLSDWCSCRIGASLGLMKEKSTTSMLLKKVLRQVCERNFFWDFRDIYFFSWFFLFFCMCIQESILKSEHSGWTWFWFWPTVLDV